MGLEQVRAQQVRVQGQTLGSWSPGGPLGDLTGYGVCEKNIWTHSKVSQRDKSTMSTLWLIHRGLCALSRKAGSEIPDLLVPHNFRGFML